MPKPSQTFKSFVHLPQEIQDEIWSYACLFPRVISVKVDYGGGAPAQVLVHPGCHIPPALLHVCHRARELAMKVQRQHVVVGKRLLSFNESADIIYFQGPSFHLTDDYIVKQDLALPDDTQLRYLATPLKDYLRRGHLDTFGISNFMAQFPHLEELMLIVFVPPDNCRMSITGFRSAEKFNFCWRDDIGKLQIDNFIDQLANLNVGDEIVEGSVAPNLPKVTFKLMERERDWRAANTDVQAILRTQRKLVRSQRALRA